MTFRNSVVAFVLAVVTTGLAAATPANAQLFSGWFTEPNSSGDRQTVSFPTQFAPGQLIVSFGDRRLYHVVGRGQAVSYPIAVPRPQSRWQGVLQVSQKKVNPTWTPTPEMRQENPKLPDFVPGGHPRNPLGKHALYLGSTLYRIHGTDAPWTIGRNVSKGCVRMHNAHVAELFSRVAVGTKVTATWQKFQTASVANWQQPAPKSNSPRAPAGAFAGIFPN